MWNRSHDGINRVRQEKAAAPRRMVRSEGKKLGSLAAALDSRGVKHASPGRRGRLPALVVHSLAFSVMLWGWAPAAATSAAGTGAVTLDYGGTSSVAVDLNSGPAANSARLSSPNTTISLPNLDIGSGSDEALFVALFSKGEALRNPWCKLGVRGMDPFNTTAVPGKNDRIYLYGLAHGDGIVQPGTQNLTCGWDNASLAAVGAVSFKGVQTWRAERSPAVSVNRGSGTHPFIDIQSAPNHMTLAFMLHDTGVATSLTGQTQTLQWDISGVTPNGAAATAPGPSSGTGPIRHQFTIGASLPWTVLGIDLPNQPVNIDHRWISPITATGDEQQGGTLSLTLRNFQVGAGANEYMVVGITSPGRLDNLKVTWDDVDMSQIDAFPTGNTVIRCTHFTWARNGQGPCDSYGTPTEAYLYWYGLKLPHAGNKLLSISWTNDLWGSFEPLVDAMALSFSNVDQSTPYQNINHSVGTVYYGDPASLQITSGGSNNMTVALLGNGGGAVWCNPAQDSNAPSTGFGIDFASSRAPGPSGGGIVEHTWTWGSGPADDQNTCSGLPGPTWPEEYGMSGFDIVTDATTPPSPPLPPPSPAASNSTHSGFAPITGDSACSNVIHSEGRLPEREVYLSYFDYGDGARFNEEYVLWCVVKF